MKPTAMAAAMVVGLIFVRGLHAQSSQERTLVEYNFTSSAQGWAISGDTRPAEAVFHSSGGSPGGHISHSDEALGETWYFRAPVSLLKQLASAEHGTLSYSLKQSADVPSVLDDDVIIVGPAGRLSIRFSTSPGTDWTPLSVKLSAAAAWRWNWNAPATQDQIRSVLANATSLEIRGEYHTGPDEGALDTVVLRSGTPTSETRVPVGEASLFARDIGRGRPLVVLHGGPDFDQAYLRPELDELADTYRLIYYDQRGRGKSAENVRAEDVTLASDLDDLDKVRRYFRLDAPVLLGHSWGTVLALEFALRNPTLVTHLVLMNPAPASQGQVTTLRQSYVAQLGSDMDRQRAIQAGAAYKEGNPDAVTARYRIHFKHALQRLADYEKLMTRMSAGFRSQGKDGILKAWAIEDRLYRDTWSLPGYDLLPRLRSLRIPTLVIVGEQDFIPPAIAREIAQALPDATLVAIPNCGHFAYLECGSAVRRALNDFFARKRQEPSKRGPVR